jgi:hypothetical protein
MDSTIVGMQYLDDGAVIADVANLIEQPQSVTASNRQCVSVAAVCLDGLHRHQIVISNGPPNRHLEAASASVAWRSDARAAAVAI